MYASTRVTLNLSVGTLDEIWRLRRNQSEAYNLGVEYALSAEGKLPSKFDAFKHLTQSRADGSISKHPVILQRPGIIAGVEAVSKHRRRRYGLEKAVEHWGKNEGIDAHNPVRHDRAVKRLKQHQKKGTARLYRRLKVLKHSNGPALVYHEGVKVRDDTVLLPGKTVLRTAGAVELSEGASWTGAAQIIDVTSRVTRRTLPRHRKYALILGVKRPNPEAVQPENPGDVLGVDAGVVVPLQCSDGSEYQMPDGKQPTAEIKQMKQRRSRSEVGSRRWRKQSRSIKKRYRKQQNRRIDASRKNAKQIAQKPHTAVAVEDLHVKNMMGSAKGTSTHPGKNVRGKKGLNRSLARVSISRMHTDLERACLKAGKPFVRVPPHGTSRKCHRCGAEGVRETQALFSCPVCAWVGNADLNAARNIAALGWEVGGWDSRRQTQPPLQRAERHKQILQPPRDLSI